jgi:phospholipase C
MSDRTDRVSRRAALQGLGIGLGGMAGLGCGSAEGGTDPEEPDAPHRDRPRVDTPREQEIPPGNLPATGLLGGIEHIVVLMMENRSFDHFVGALALDPGYANKATVTGLSGTESNPAPDGSRVGVFKMDNFTPEDPPHDWDPAHAQFNEGANDGFVIAHAGSSQAEVMGYHDRSQIPLYYWFADNFTLCDHWFASVMGPTWPNRMFVHATTSNGVTDNRPSFAPTNTIWDELARRGISAKNYTAAPVSWVIGGFPLKAISLGGATLSVPISAFFDAAQRGTLPAFSFIDPDFLAGDDHPSHNIQRGQAFVASVYSALAQSPLWPKTLLIVLYDEHGGFFDHVPPPKTADDRPEFAQLGFRVPAFVIGPTVKKGYVCKTQLEHSSIAATLRTRFGIANLTSRMAATTDIGDCIDPAKLSRPAVPPPGMPIVAMSLQNALYDGVGVDSQPALGEMLANGTLRPTNPMNHQARIGSWLEHATRLGAVRIVGS